MKIIIIIINEGKQPWTGYLITFLTPGKDHETDVNYTTIETYVGAPPTGVLLPAYITVPMNNKSIADAVGLAVPASQTHHMSMSESCSSSLNQCNIDFVPACNMWLDLSDQQQIDGDSNVDTLICRQQDPGVPVYRRFPNADNKWTFVLPPNWYETLPMTLLTQICTIHYTVKDSCSKEGPL